MAVVRCTLLMLISVSFISESGVVAVCSGLKQDCPTPWLTHGGHCYLWVDMPMSWMDAERYCQTLPYLWNPAHLTSINSQEEDEFVSEYVGKASGRTPPLGYWIGYGRTMGSPFQWTDGSDVTYEGWTPGQPSIGQEQEDCVERYHWADRWNDNSCGKTVRFVCKIYGNVVSLNLFWMPIVVLHGHSTIKEAFSKFQLCARPEAHLTESLIPGTGIIQSSGQQWVQIRRFCTTVLRGLGVGKSSFEKNISIEVENLVEEVRKYNGAAFDPKRLVSNAVSNVICAVVFGKRFQYTDPEFERLLGVLNDIFVESGDGDAVELFPVFVKLKRLLPFVRRYEDAIKHFYSQMQRLLKEHNHVPDGVNSQNFIDVFLDEKKVKENLGVESLVLTNENLLHIVGDLFAAGSETTVTTLRWGMLYMMAYPEIQSRVQKELDDVAGRNRFPRMADKPDLPYTEAVLCEIQRMGTIVPLALPHMCSEDTTLLGYNIPKGTVIFSNIWHSHFDPAVWKEPRKFWPERFLDENVKFRPREELTPFGVGRRVCVGEQLAKMELFIFTHLLHQFTFKKPDNVPSVSFKGTYGIVWAPANFKVCAIIRG